MSQEVDTPLSELGQSWCRGVDWGVILVEKEAAVTLLILLPKKGSFAPNLLLQSCQCCDVAVRVNGLILLQELTMDQPLKVKEHGAHGLGLSALTHSFLWWQFTHLHPCRRLPFCLWFKCCNPSFITCHDLAQHLSVILSDQGQVFHTMSFFSPVWSAKLRTLLLPSFSFSLLKPIFPFQRLFK